MHRGSSNFRTWLIRNNYKDALEIEFKNNNIPYEREKEFSIETIYMTKKNILIALITFIIGFGTTFYIIRTYFPKNKIEKTVVQKDTLAQP